VSGCPDVAGVSLGGFLGTWAAGEAGREAVAGAVSALAEAARRIAGALARGSFGGVVHEAAAGRRAEGDSRGDDSWMALEAQAARWLREAAQAAPVAWYAGGTQGACAPQDACVPQGACAPQDAIAPLRPGAPLALVAVPLDGAAEIDVDLAAGSIFSLYPASPRGCRESFLRRGEEQVAAGYFVYGPHAALVLTLRAGVDVFVLHPEAGTWHLARSRLRIPESTSEFAIDPSNYRHWDGPLRTFIDDCLEGAEGPRGKDFRIRWLASLLAETHRILLRGGVLLHPADRRPGHGQGRLRLLHEAAPLALLVEQAGGAATDAIERILDKVPAALEQRTPLVFGSAEKVARIAAYHVNPAFARDLSPLFRQRGLFRD